MEEAQEEVKVMDEVQEEIKEVVSESAEKSIKETKEVMAALSVLADFLAKVMADGQVNASDFVHLVGLMQKLEVFTDAFGNIKEVGSEVKDLDQAELIELGMMAYSLVQKVVMAVKKK